MGQSLHLAEALRWCSTQSSGVVSAVGRGESVAGRTGDFTPLLVRKCADPTWRRGTEAALRWTGGQGPGCCPVQNGLGLLAPPSREEGPHVLKQVRGLVAAGEGPLVDRLLLGGAVEVGASVDATNDDCCLKPFEDVSIGHADTKGNDRRRPSAVPEDTTSSFAFVEPDSPGEGRI